MAVPDQQCTASCCALALHRIRDTDAFDWRLSWSHAAPASSKRNTLLIDMYPTGLSTDAGDSEMIGTIASVRRCWIPIMGVDNVLFLQRLLLHYGIYRRYPLKPWPAFKNAWRIAFR
jgi:hypothetical protein